MDADDISVPSRFERQLGYLQENPSVDIIGGYLEEFQSSPDDPVARREVPTDHDAIVKRAKFRSPMNHGTVMFRREAVLRAGNYRATDPMEDYDLWVRMLLSGATFGNIPEILLKARAGEKLYERRGGWKYAKDEARLLVSFYKRGFTPLHVLIFNLLTRTPLRLFPNRLRGTIYELFARV